MPQLLVLHVSILVRISLHVNFESCPEIIDLMYFCDTVIFLPDLQFNRSSERFFFLIFVLRMLMCVMKMLACSAYFILPSSAHIVPCV